MSATAAEDEAAAQRAWEMEMEMAIESRGRTRSHSILGDQSQSEDEGSTGGRRRGLYDDSSDDGTSSDSDLAIRDRARSFSARRALEMEEEDQNEPALEGNESFDDRARRRSCSFSSGDAAVMAKNDGGNPDEDPELVAKRAASLSKMYLVGSAPVDVSKLQDDSKIVGVKKVEVVQPTGALSAKALDALSEGLQLSVDNSPMPNSRDEAELTEEQLEEKRMEEEEDHKLKAEKMSTRRSLTARASLFKSKMFKSSQRMGSATAKNTKPSTPAVNGASAAASKPADAKAEPASNPDLPPVPKKRHKLKLLLLGDSGVGKTSLMRVFSGDEFSESMLATAGVDFKLRHINVADEEIALQIWDTAGQERFHRITATYYKGANGIVLVYDVSDKRSFDNVGYWMNNILQYSSPNQLPAMLLVGNKIDLPNRVVGSEEGQAAASQYHCRFIETSAKTSENTNGALETIARDAFLMSVNPSMTQKGLIDREKSFGGRRNKENCTVQ